MTVAQTARPAGLSVRAGSALERGRQEREIAALLLAETRTAFLQLKAALRPRAWLRRQPPGVLFSVGNYGHPAAWAAWPRLPGLRRVYRISNDFVLDRPLGDRLRNGWMRLLARDADGLALLGDKLGRHPLFGNALHAGRAMVIANGVDGARARR